MTKPEEIIIQCYFNLGAQDITMVVLCDLGFEMDYFFTALGFVTIGYTVKQLINHKTT